MKCALATIIVFLCLSQLPGCLAPNQEDQVTVENIVAKPTPTFILDLWPEPGSTLTLEWYDTANHVFDSSPSSVCIEFGTDAFLEPGDFLSSEELLNRFSLAVDGKKINKPDYIFLHDTESWEARDPDSGEVLYRVPAGDPFILCFVSELAAGRHIATFAGSTSSGEEMTYTWSFVLVDQ